MLLIIYIVYIKAFIDICIEQFSKSNFMMEPINFIAGNVCFWGIAVFGQLYSISTNKY